MAIEPATEKSMQDNASDLEALLYPVDSQEDEPIVTDGDEVSDDGENLPDDDDSDSDDDEGSDDLDNIAEGEELTLAGYLGLNDDRIIENEDGQFVFNAIVDGETKQVPLSELAANFQMQSHVNNKSIALENERKEFEEVRGQATTELQNRIQGLSKLGEIMEQELVGEYESIDWNKLRIDDPANWTALRQEYAERAQKVKEVQTLVGEEGNRIQTEQKQKFEEQANKYFQGELNAMISDNPEWADEGKRNEAMTGIKSFLTNYGFTEKDAQGVNDHRLIRLIKDAQAYRTGKKAAEGKREGKKLPKFQKPGGNRGNAASLATARKAKALKARVKKTGHVKDIAASILDRM